MGVPWWHRLLVICAAVFGGLSLTIYLIDSDLVSFFLPVRSITVLGLLATAGLLATRVFVGTGRDRRLVYYVMAGAAVVVAGLVYLREFAAYREEHVSFENAGVTLSGTLYLPELSARYPTVVIAQGSVRAPRRLYHMWADKLVRNGIAVYSFDKRGTGESGGTYEAENNASEENLTLLASDVAAAVEALRRYPEVDDSRLGVMGLSMGGWLAPLATRETDAINFMVLVSGPSVSVGEESYYSDLTGEIHGQGSGIPQATIDSLVFAQSPSGFDPRSILRRLSVPSLWLHGAADSSVPVAKSVVVLDSLADYFGRPCTYVIYPDAEHLGFVIRWPFDLAPGLVDELVDWLNSRRR